MYYWYLLMLYVNSSVKHLKFAPNWPISSFQPILAAIFVTIAMVKVGVTMYNVRNIRISDSCVYAQIGKRLGMHLVTYTNRDTVPFLLLVQYKGGLSEIEFIVSLFSNACMILLLFFKILEILCTSHYISGGIAHSC